ncbi:MAG: hypothetical protein JST42_26010 [Bacteroidetes bacterium]|nr:hypothetical protein [Bacteroidota bacterium]
MDTTSPSTHSPASVSLPVSPDDDSRFDRTASPSPAFPKETLQQCGVSRVIHIHACPPAPALINILEQAAALGYNTLHLTGADHRLEELVTTSHTLGYLNTLTTTDTPLTPRILRHLDHVTLSIGGKPETHDRLLRRRGAFARMLRGIPIISNSVDSLGFTHTLRPDSWQILSWLTDFAMHHKASRLQLSTHTPAHSRAMRWTDVDLYRIYIAHYYLKTFAEPELLIRIDLHHRHSLIDKAFSTPFNELTIDEHGDILPVPHGCSKFFRMGNIYAKESLATLIQRFMEEKHGYLMQLYNNTYREILGSGDDLFNWTQQIVDASHRLATTIT